MPFLQNVVKMCIRIIKCVQLWSDVNFCVGSLTFKPSKPPKTQPYKQAHCYSFPFTYMDCYYFIHEFTRSFLLYWIVTDYHSMINDYHISYAFIVISMGILVCSADSLFCIFKCIPSHSESLTIVSICLHASHSGSITTANANSPYAKQ